MPIISILLSCAFSASMVPAILHSHISKVSTIRSMRGKYTRQYSRLGGVGIASAFLLTAIIIVLLHSLFWLISAINS